MTIAEVLLQDFDSEMRSTRVTLERIASVPADFKPHPKSMPSGRLAAHLSTLPLFAITILSTPELDLGTAKFPPLAPESREKLLHDFDTLAMQAREILAGSSDEHLSATWKCFWGEHIIANGPRSAVYRTMFLNHLVHHRAQLGVYLRLNGMPVPNLYGPSADEQ